jgi:hypothetical protein
MTEAAIEVLERLLQEAPGAEPYDLRVTDWLDDEQRNTTETQELWANFLSQYQETVQAISMAWGEPQFDGSYEDTGFPSWHHWVARLAYWQRGDAIAYVECDQQDSEAPMILSIGVKVGEELEEDYT